MATAQVSRAPIKTIARKITARNDMVIQSVPMDSAMKAHLLKKCKEEGVTFSAMIRECVIHRFPELADTNMNVRRLNSATPKRAAKTPAKAAVRDKAVQEALDYLL